MATEAPPFVPREFRAYTNLSPAEQAKVAEVVAHFVIRPGEEGYKGADPDRVRDSVMSGLVQYGADAPCILTLVGVLRRDSLVRPGLFDELANLLGVRPEAGKKASLAIETLKIQARDKGYSLPQLRGVIVEAIGEGSKLSTLTDEQAQRVAAFIAARESPSPAAPKLATSAKPDAAPSPFPFKLPAAKQTREEFIAEIEKEAQAAKPYPANMLDFDTGAINWECPNVFTYEKGSVAFEVFRALVEGPTTYDDLLARPFNGKALRDEEKAVVKTLKGIAVEPSYLPPGAGVFTLDPESGFFWIERDPIMLLADAIPFMA